jgi:hypothetical protein
MRISNVHRYLGFGFQNDPEMLERFVDGLRKVGVAP